VQKIGTGKPSEDNPISYKVTHRGGALVRAGYETTSAQVHQLPAGEIVTVVELVGRRARLVTPVEGWISIETKEGVQIMKQCTVQRKGQQTEAFETMFERKFQKMKERQSGTSDPRAERTPSNSPSPRDRQRDPYSRDDRDFDRDRDYNRDRGGYDRDRGRRDRSPYSDRDSDLDDRDAYRSRKKDPFDSPSKSSKSTKGDERGREKQDIKFVPKLSAPSGGSDSSFIPRLSAPGSQLGPTPTIANNAPSSNNAAPAPVADLFDMDAPPPAASSAGASGGIDLLDMASGGGPSAVSSAPFDPFASAPVTATPAPAAAAGASSAAAANADWGAFSAAPASQPAQPANNMMAAFGAQPGMQQPSMQQASMQQAQPPMAPGWGGNYAAPAMGAMGYGGPTGMGMPGMPGMAPGMAMGQGSPYQQGMGRGGGGAWAPFGAAPAAPGPAGMAGAPQRPPAPMGMATGQQRPTGTAPGSNVDDLLSQAMDGVTAMSFEQRRGPTSGTSMRPGLPMNAMTQQQPNFQGW